MAYKGPVGRGEDSVSSLLRRVTEAAQRLPGADFAQRQLERIETRVLSELRSRMDRIEDRQQVGHGLVVVGAVVDTAAGARGGLQQRMATLLECAESQTREQALDTLYGRILGELVPDEARILGALSDGSVYPLVHVAAGPRVGAGLRRVSSNFCMIGKPAGVRLLELVPEYIGHLRHLGLLRTGPESKDLEIKYQVLEGDATVRRVIEDLNAAKGAGTSVRTLRRTLRLSDLGQRFWKACVPTV